MILKVGRWLGTVANHQLEKPTLESNEAHGTHDCQLMKLAQPQEQKSQTPSWTSFIEFTKTNF